MINLNRNKQQPTWQTISKEIIVNALQIFLMAYGLKCILFEHGKMLLSVRQNIYYRHHLVPVSGMAAAVAGLLYFSFGLFIYLSDGAPPSENRRWFWRIGRGLLRWGSLLLAVLCAFRADKIVTGRSFDISGLPPHLLITIILFAGGFIFLLLFLFAMLAREQVKKDLWSRGCKPMYVWWRPAAYWASIYWWVSFTGGAAFRVIYSDPAKFVHKGYCFVYHLPNKRNLRLRWLADAVTGQLPLPEVWVDNEISRPELKDQNLQSNDFPDESDNAPADV